VRPEIGYLPGCAKAVIRSAMQPAGGCWPHIAGGWGCAAHGIAADIYDEDCGLVEVRPRSN